MAQSSDIGVSKKVETLVTSIKSESTLEAKNKKLEELIKLINEEYKYSFNTVSELKIKLQSNPLDADGNIFAEKNQSEIVFESWAVYKGAFDPLNKFFIKKSNSYHCDVISEEIWQEYAPHSPVEKKIELDPYAKKAVTLAVEIAVDICKISPYIPY